MDYWNCVEWEYIRRQCGKREVPERFKQPGKLEGGGATGRAPGYGPQAFRRDEKVWSLKHGIDGVFVEGMVKVNSYLQ